MPSPSNTVLPPPSFCNLAHTPCDEDYLTMARPPLPGIQCLVNIGIPFLENKQQLGGGSAEHFWKTRFRVSGWAVRPNLWAK